MASWLQYAKALILSSLDKSKSLLLAKLYKLIRCNIINVLNIINKVNGAFYDYLIGKIILNHANLY